MESSTWQVILAVGVASVLQAIAYAIREWINGKARARLQTAIDGTATLTATNLVSNGNLPRAAPCIPAVAHAVSQNIKGCRDAVDYATTATNVAHATMEREGIPIQNQELLVKKLKSALDDTRAQADETAAKEARHSENNTAWVKLLREEMERLKIDFASLKDAPSPKPIQERE